MGSGKSKAAVHSLNGVFPPLDDDPTPEQLKAAEASNLLLQQQQTKPSISSPRQAQAQAASTLEAEFNAPLPPPPPLELNFQAVKELWFHSAYGGRGRSLVELKDTVASLAPLFHQMYETFTASTEIGMTVLEFVQFVNASLLDLDPSSIQSNFFECTKYPNDEDDPVEVAAIHATLGQFASAVVRISNAYIMQEFGESEKGLHTQLQDWLIAYGKNIIPTLNQSTMDATIVLRDPSFFQPPSDFVGTVNVYLVLAWEGEGQVKRTGKVTIALNATASPKCAYNFKCLCTGEKGNGEITGLPLTLKGCSFHRIIQEMCLQGGDLEGQDGYGGESIYGGEFEDEPFTEGGLSHSSPGIVSMGNSGVNTNTSQFFITLGPCTHLDKENNIFGKVVEGLEHVLQIGASCETDEDDKPIVPVTVEDCGLC